MNNNIQIFNRFDIPAVVRNVAWSTLPYAYLAAFRYRKELCREFQWYGGDLINRVNQASHFAKQFFYPKVDLSSDDPGLKKFIENDVLSISDRTFQHILGEPFGKGSLLEGMNPLEMTGHLLDVLYDRVEAMKDFPCPAEGIDRFCRDDLMQSGDSSLSHFELISKQMEIALGLRRAFDHSPQSFYNAFLPETEKLRVGESFFFPGGWSDKGLMGGHAIVYEVIRETEESYAFRIYNRGEGAEYHEQFLEGKKSKLLPFTEIEGILKEKLLSPTFLQSLQELREEPPFGDESWKSFELYETLLPLLEGKISHKHFNPAQGQDPQIVGHCSYMSWAALLHEHMGKEGNYERFEYELQFKTLRDYFLQNENRLTDSGVAARFYKEFLRIAKGVLQHTKAEIDAVSNPISRFIDAQPQFIKNTIGVFSDFLDFISLASKEISYRTESVVNDLALENEGARHLVQKGSAYFARNVDALFLKGGISEKEAAYTAKWIERIQTALNIAEKKYRTEFAERPLLSEALKAPSHSGFTVIQYENGHLLSSSGFEKSLSRWIPPLAIPPYCQETFHRDLADFSSKLREAGANGSHLDAFMGIQKFVQKIPIERISEGEGFWSSLSKKEAEETLSLLANLSREYYFSIMKDPRLVNQLTAADYLTQIKLLALGDAISRHALKTAIPNLYESGYLNLILEREAVSGSLFDPAWGSQIEHLKSYFSRISLDGKFSSKSFFHQEDYKNVPIQWNEEWRFEDFCNSRRCIRRKKELPQDIEWVKTRLQEPMIQSEMKRLFPEISPNDPLDQAMFFAFADTDEGRQILGRPFYELRDLSLLSKAILLLRGTDSQSHDPLKWEILASNSANFEQGIVHRAHFIPKEKTSMTEDFWIEETAIFGIENLLTPRMRPYYLLHKADWLKLNSNKNEADPLSSDLSRIFERTQSQQRRRTPPHELLLNSALESLSLKELNFQDVRELLALSSFPELQIQETFGYFRERPYLLKNQNYQKFFKKLMFEPGLLIKEFEKSGRLAKSLAIFCKEQYLFHSRLRDIGSALYFLDLSQLFEAHVQEGKEKYPAAFPKKTIEFLSGETEFLKLLSFPNLSDEERGDIILQRALSYQFREHLEPEEAKHLLLAALWGSFLSPDEYEKIQLSNHKVRAIGILLSRFRSEIRSLLETSNANSTINELVRTIRPDVGELVWKASPYPRFVAEEGAFAIDVLQGSLSEAGSSLRMLPFNLRNTPLVSSVCEQDERVLGIQDVGGSWEFSNKKKEEYRLVDEKMLYRKFDGSWAKKMVPLIRLPLPLLEKCASWIHQDEFVLITDKERVLARIDLTPLPLLARVDLSTLPPAWEKPYQSTGLVEKIENGKRTGYFLENLLEMTKSGYDTLERFAGKDNLLIWKKEDALPIVEIPYLGLSFRGAEKEGKISLLCNEIKGMRIAERQEVPLLEKIERFLVLEGKEGKKTVLIPNGALELAGGGSLAPLYTLKKTEKDPKFFRYQWNENGLTPQNIEGRLHLALLFLAYQDYESSHAQLKTLASHLRPYKKNEADILSTIVSFDKNNADVDPRAIAVRSYATYLFKRNRVDAFLEVDDSHLESEYFQKQFQIPPHLRLSKEEEEFLFPDLPSQTRNKILLQDKFLQDTTNWTQVREYLLSEHTSIYNIQIEWKNPFRPRFLSRSSSALLRQSAIGEDYDALYALLREPLTDASAREILDRISPTLLSTQAIHTPLTLDQKKREIEAQLLLAMRGQSEVGTKAAAAILLALLHDPTPFPTAESMMNHKYTYETSWRSRGWHLINLAYPAIQHLQSWISSRTPPSISTLPGADVFWPKPIEVPPKAPLLPFSPPPHFSDAGYGKAPISNLSDYLEEIPLSSETKSRFTAANKMLEVIFSYKPKDRIARRKFEELLSMVKKYGLAPEISPQYRIRSGADLIGLEKNLSQEAADLKERLIVQEERLLEIAKKTPSTKKGALSLFFQKASGDSKELSLSEILLNFGHLATRSLQEMNPALTVAETHALHQMSGAYLIHATRYQHLMRILTSLKKVQNASGKEEEVVVSLREFAIEVNAKREYEIQKHPEYLLFEYANNILLRQAQVENLDRLKIQGKSKLSLHDLGVALEMIMASGKTAVLLPLMALFEADGEHIPFVVMPASLLPTMSEELERRFSSSFGKEIDVISISRSTDLNQASLRRIFKRLDSAKVERKAIVMTSESLQSFFLKFVEAMEKKNVGEIALYRKILYLMRQSGQATLDEMDLILDILKSHHFNHGPQEPIQKEVVATVADLYRLLAESPTLRVVLNVPFMPLPGGKPFTPSHYQKEIQPLLVDEILKGDFSMSNPELQEFFQTLGNREKKWVESYLYERPEAESFAFIDRLSSMKLKNCLAILKEEISQLLPLTMKKQVDEHYGMVPDGETVAHSPWLAIPYHGSNNPALRSQFGTSLETLNYTTQQYLAKGIPIKMLEKELNSLRKAAIEYMKKYPKKKVEECAAYQAFERLLGPLSFDLFAITPLQMEALRQRINKTPRILIDFIRRYALDEIKQSPEQLNTNAQIISMIFKGLKGFTGTMWNAETFPRAFAEFFLSDTDVKTLHLLAEKGMDLSPQILEKPIESEGFILDALSKMFQGSSVGSIGDTGGIFRNFENSLVAKKLLEVQKQGGYEGVIFYDAKDNLMVWERGKTAPIPLASSDLPFYKMAAYWDQKHLFGSNLQLSSNMHAVFTISRHTLMRDLLQAVWRLRKLDNGQTVSFALLQEDAEVINSTLAKLKNTERPNPLGDLFLYLLYNQSQRQGEDNFRGLRQKLQNVLLDPLIEAFGDPALTDDAILEIFAITRDLFVSSTVKDLYLAIGKLKTTASSHTVIEETVENLIRSAPFQAFRTHPALQSRRNIDEMEKEITLIAKEELPRLPEELVKTETYNREIEVETEAENRNEVNTENEVSTETEKQKQKLTDDRTFNPYPVFAWDKDALFDKKSYSHLDLGAYFDYRTPWPDLTQKSWAKQGLSSFFSIQDVIDRQRTGFVAFDSNLLTTPNFSPIYLGKHAQKTPSNLLDLIGNRPPSSPFGEFQESSMNLLVIQDKSTGKIQVAMLNLDDVKSFDLWLQQDRKSPFSGKKEVKLGLYHFANGLYRQGSEEIGEEALETNPAFLRLKAQAKFFNGHLFFTEKEWPFLKKWIESQGKEPMFKLMQQILSSKPTSRNEFPQTELYAFLLES